jgi:hypothetical protein
MREAASIEKKAEQKTVTEALDKLTKLSKHISILLQEFHDA